VLKAEAANNEPAKKEVALKINIVEASQKSGDTSSKPPATKPDSNDLPQKPSTASAKITNSSHSSIPPKPDSTKALPPSSQSLNSPSLTLPTAPSAPKVESIGKAEVVNIQPAIIKKPVSSGLVATAGGDRDANKTTDAKTEEIATASQPPLNSSVSSSPNPLKTAPSAGSQPIVKKIDKTGNYFSICCICNFSKFFQKLY
jgi:hypothetical protein